VLHSADESLDHLRTGDIVSINAKEELPLRFAQTTIAGCADAGVGLPQEAELRVALAHPLEHSDGLGIVGAVVDDKHLEARPGLGRQRGQRFGQIRREVEKRYDNADQRWFPR